MDHHEASFGQVEVVNNTNQEGEFILDPLVQEIIVQSNDNQDSSVNCEIRDVEVILPNDCVNDQNSSDHNVNLNIHLSQESANEVSIKQINNLEENISSFNDNLKEDKIEELILDNQTSYPENFDVNSLTTNKETDGVSEVTIHSSEAISGSNENITVPILNDNHVVKNSQSTIDNVKENEDKSIKNLKQELHNTLSNKETECTANSVADENIESIEVKNEPNVINENIVSSDQSQSKNCDVKAAHQKDFDNVFSSNSDIDLLTKETNLDDIPLPKDEYSLLSAATATDSKIVTNSDDVAVLTEFSCLEYEESETAEERLDFHKPVEVIKEKTESIKDTENSTSLVTKETVDQSKEPKSSDESLSNQATPNRDIKKDSDEDEEDDLDLHLSTQSTENHRKVIQDIFDDWQDENVEDENNQSSSMFKVNHDSVEMELQNLLNDDAQQEETIFTSNTNEDSLASNENCKSPEKKTNVPSVSSKITKSPLKKSGSDTKTSPSIKSPKSISNHTPVKDQSVGRSPKAVIQDQLDSKQKHQSPRPGVKVPGLHLTSQIASTAEVNEVLKERLREKQKDLVVTKAVDIVFMKKITQRLSSQLSAAASVAVPPPLIPLQPTTSDNESDKEKVTEESTADNQDLLAILEGDVDPDWSNLKSQSITEDNKMPNSGETINTSSKLDPAIERELALKQLLELPNIPVKKNSVGSSKKNKKTTKSAGNKNANDTSESKLSADDNESNLEVINLDTTEEESPSKKNKSNKVQKENNSQNTRSSVGATLEVSVEESRSGRKRKLTEKAREHELSVKRQKVIKGKVVSENKKSSQESTETSKRKLETTSPVANKTTDNAKAASELNSSNSPKFTQNKTDTKQSDSEINTQMDDKVSEEKASVKRKMIPVKRPKIGLVKKDVPISKRKLAVKNLLRRNVTSKKAVAAGKAKVQASSTPKLVSSNKTTPEKSSPVTSGVKTKKVATEIDRLLQDEGVVNLLYDVEQPDSRKRLVPITKSQKKIMDIEKAERELKLRTKLVRNAVLRLRNSSTTTVKFSPRSRRNVSATNLDEQVSPGPDKKSNEQSRSPKSPTLSSVPSDFIIPAKIRNAADASRIIRRHSSSSFSSASASPRVSIDLPNELVKSEDVESQTKIKRKMSQDTNEKLDTKKSKKKVSSKSDIDIKETVDKSPVKKEPAKKIATRSNNSTPTAVSPPTMTKTIPKNKKVPKNKTSSELSYDVKSSPKDQDELSACLAEAASVLSTVSGSSRSSNATTSRKKGSTNSKTQSDDEKVDIKKLFTNKEINVRQHGHLAQLILTPSTPVSGIRNAITIQVMNEMKEALSILSNDDECRVVLFTSTGTSFCEGLELSSLLHSNKEERKSRAEEMATTVKEFVKTLASFNKPIVAGVQGAAIGLGVTMLPLFDLVIASDKATFSTPYGKLGQIAEGAAVLTLSHSLGSAVTNELLLGGRILTASEALRAGLVTRVLWPDRFQGELLPSLKAMSEQSSQSMESTKALLRHSLRKKLDAALESECSLLIKHWCSLECQEAIKAFIDEKGQ